MTDGKMAQRVLQALDTTKLNLLPDKNIFSAIEISADVGLTPIEQLDDYPKDTNGFPRSASEHEIQDYINRIKSWQRSNAMDYQLQ